MAKTKSLVIDDIKIRVGLPHRRIIWAETYQLIEDWIQRGIVQEVITPIGNTATVDWFLTMSYPLNVKKE